MYPAKSLKGVSIYRSPLWFASWPSTQFDAVELAFQDIRCGSIKPGDSVYVYDDESGTMRTMVAGSFGGNPSLSDIGPAPRGIIPFPFMKKP